MQNSNPSAPPEEVDDFQWIAESININEDKKEKENEHVYPILNQPRVPPQPHPQPQPQQQQPAQIPSQQNQGFVQPADMAIPDSVTQQLIYQRIMEEQRKKKQEAEAKQAESNDDNHEQYVHVAQPQQYQPPQPQPQPVQQPAAQLNGPKPSYMAQDIQYPETALYKAAGLCIWRPKPNGKGIELMMGLENTDSSLSFFGGKRNDADKTCVDTAIREFHEETAKILDNETLTQIRRMLINDSERRIFWKAEWFSVLFYYQMSYDYGIVDNYKQQKAWNAEMKSLHWVDFQKVYNSVCITGNLVKVGTNKHPLRSFVVGTLLHEENRKYLLQLHEKHGGDMNMVKPKYGGTIRNAVKSFKNIPKAIRLDIVSPMNHHLLFSRWMEMNVTDIEDYQLLLSLIGSICPEIGRNFCVYYTNNEHFKTSQKQYVIDTVPAFNALRERLSAKKQQFVTKLNVLPTFIISDNFKGCSFACKASDVSWKHINACNDDDEKGMRAVAGLVNKAANFAQSWLGGAADSDENDEDGDEDEMLWKWQFMNDKNKFEDFEDSVSRHIEKQFVMGYSFTNFTRKSVAYQANFKTMCQKNLNSTKLRAIRRVPSSVKGDNNSNNNDVNGYSGYNYRSPVLQYYKWQYQENDGSWTDYDVSISKQLNSFKVGWDNNAKNYHYHIYRSKKRFDIRYTYSCNIRNNNNGQNYSYLIDVKHFKQQNVETKKERNVRQIPVYDNNNQSLISLPYFMNNNNGIQYKWQYKDDGYNKWSDYDTASSQYIEQQFLSNAYTAPFTLTCSNHKNYKIFFNTMQQQCSMSGKFRSIRRKPLPYFANANGVKSNAAIKHRWEWQDDNNKAWKRYDNNTSSQIESACNSGIKKFFFVSSKNNNSYEINFATMSQYNVQTGKQRNVRKVKLEPKWNGAGPDPRKYKGPMGMNAHRRTFDKKVMYLYCVVGNEVANEVQKCGKLIRGTLGPFGCGLYFYDQQEMAKKMAQDRSSNNRGHMVKAKVFVGKTHDVSNMDDKEFDFITLQKMAFDSVSRNIGFGKEFIVYNLDQVCIEKVNKY